MKYLTKIVMLAVLALGLTFVATPVQAGASDPIMISFDLNVVADETPEAFNTVGAFKMRGAIKADGAADPILYEIPQDPAVEGVYNLTGDVDLYVSANCSLAIHTDVTMTESGNYDAGSNRPANATIAGTWTSEASDGCDLKGATNNGGGQVHGVLSSDVPADSSLLELWSSFKISLSFTGKLSDQ